MIKEKSKKSAIFSVIFPLICCLIFAFFCTLNLTGSIWFDESYSAYLARGSFGDIWNLTGLDVHPPFYYFLLKIWASIFGYTDFSMRFMSVFFGALAIILAFQLFKRWFGIKISAAMTFLLSLAPLFLRYGQEMRMYTLVFFIVIAATYVLDLALETKKTRYYVFYAILIALGMWTQYFTAIAWLAHIVYYKFTRRSKIFDKKMFFSYLLAIALFLPWLPSFVHQVTDVESGFWIPSISLATPADFVSQTLIYKDAADAISWLVPLLLIVIISTIILTRKAYTSQVFPQPKFFFLLALIIVPPLLLMIFSLPPLTSMFVDRYILYSSAFIWALIGLVLAVFLLPDKSSQKSPHTFSKSSALARPKKFSAVANSINTKVLATVLAVASVVTVSIGIVNVETREPRGKIKDIITAVDAVSTAGEPIVADNCWNYYDAVFYSTTNHPVYGIDAQIDYIYGSIEPIRVLRYNLIDDISVFAKDHSKFWYLTNLDDNNSIDDYKLPTGNYRATSYVSASGYLALELENVSSAELAK